MGVPDEWSSLMNVASPSIAMRQSAGSPPRPLWPSTTPRATIIAALAVAGIVAHLALRWGSNTSPAGRELPLYVVLAAGGIPLVLSLALKLVRHQFGSDLLAGISIVAAVLLEEYLAGAFVVLMLLLIGIPVAIIGAISLAAKRSIIIRDPAVLERIDGCRTIVLDKTGTLTYGEPTLTDRFLPRAWTMRWRCSPPRAWNDTRSIRWLDPSSKRQRGSHGTS